MNPLEFTLEILRYIKDGGFWSLLLGGLCWSIYLGLSIAIPSVFIVKYLPYATFGGLLIGSAIDKKLALTNNNENVVNEEELKDKILENRIDSMWKNVDLRRISESEASEITTQAYRQLILSSQENETTNLLESQEQRQIPPSQEEE
jgi:hypothetical protein